MTEARPVASGACALHEWRQQFPGVDRTGMQTERQSQVLNQAHSQDAALIERVLDGDKDAYGYLVQRHSRSLLAIAYRVTQNEQDAEEVVQEAFLRAYRNLERFERRSNFGTWLYRIAMNCALDMKQAKRGTTVEISEEPEPGENQIQLPA